MERGSARDDVVLATNGNGDGRDRADSLRRFPMTPKVVAEVHGLHDRTVELSGEHGRQARRDLRGARAEESDLLRVLGFESYEEFLTVVGAPESPEEPVPEAPVADEPVAIPGADEALLRDARETEASLLRILNDVKAQATAVPAEIDLVDRFAEPDPDDLVAELQARVAGLETELTHTRIELRELRDELRAQAANGQRGPHIGEEAQAIVTEARARAIALVREALAAVEFLDGLEPGTGDRDARG